MTGRAGRTRRLIGGTPMSSRAALRAETNPFLLARYRFYLAQSYRDFGELDKALEHYLARAELGFWQEEVFISLYSAASLRSGSDIPGRTSSTRTYAPRMRRRDGSRRCTGRVDSADTRSVTRRDIGLQNGGFSSRCRVQFAICRTLDL